MPAGPLPPLRVREADGSPNVIPVFELVVSGMTLTKTGPTTVQLRADSGGTSIVYAPSGGTYVTHGGWDASLPEGKQLVASTGIVLTFVAASAMLQADSLLVTTSRTVTAGVGITGGGNLGADITLNLNTGSTGQYMVTSAGATEGIAWINTAAVGGGPVYAPTGGSYLAYSADGDLTAERVLTASTGISLNSADTGVVYVHYGSLLVTTTRAVNTVSPLAGGGNLSADRTFSVTTGGAGTLFSAGGTFITTQAVVRTTTIRIPLALSTVQPTSGNAFWQGRTSTTIDVSYVAFVDSGIGLATYWGVVPPNVADTENWNLLFYQSPDTGAGGNVVLSVSAATVVAGGSIPGAALTGLMAAVALSTRASGVLEVSTGTATSFDGTLGLTGGDYFTCQVWRLGGAAGDTVSAQWNLYSVTLKIDVVT